MKPDGLHILNAAPEECPMPKFFSPGDLISDAAGLTGDNRVIFRMFINTLVWGAVCSGIMIGLLT
jgi:hypothetical protein